MPAPLVRASLVTQTAHALRTSIVRGEYGDCLLPERVLSDELGVSRPTLRAALEQLQGEGLLELKGRQARRILLTKHHAQRRISVRLLQDSGPTSFINEHLKIQTYLAEHLRGENTEFHIDTAPSVFSGNPKRALERLIRSRPADLWILYFTTAAIQKWFQASGLPCLVLGSCYPGINLISIDEDYRSVCRHAAGALIARNHRQLAVLAPKLELRTPGDVASVEGFEEGIERSRRNNIESRVVSHNMTREGVCKAVDQAMARPTPPTGWLIIQATMYLTVSSHLARRGIVVGRDISLICRNFDPYIEALVPTVAHYQRNTHLMTRRLVEMIHQTVTGQPLTRRRWLIGSKFRDGESLQLHRRILGNKNKPT